jgi:quercetin dioxygenase-like cupin family protein
MVTRPIWMRLLVAGIGLGLMGCSEQATAPTALAEGASQDASAMQAHHGMNTMMTDVLPLSTEPFTFRTTLDPDRIQQIQHLARLMARSKAGSDIVIQRLVFQPGAGPWHTHPGTSFVNVIEGEIKLERVLQEQNSNRKARCTTTPVFGAGDAYSEAADEVHRAVVVSAEPVVLLVMRFNLPAGAPITIPADDPGCE